MRMHLGMDTNHARKDLAILDAQSEEYLAPAIILVRPYLDKNVGTVARSMLNFGISDLRIVDPQCNHLSDEARALASGASGVLERAKVCSSVAEAVGDLVAVYATTARIRGMTHMLLSPRAAAARAAEAAAAAAQRPNAVPQRSGFLFGTPFSFVHLPLIHSLWYQEILYLYPHTK